MNYLLNFSDKYLYDMIDFKYSFATFTLNYVLYFAIKN
ncbi:hypothetical protein HMPREF9289_0983 [Finegoldia magna BVS033A4]|uniref:Uncharacterized protein n=1 Tax=Finegoldia magna BVS033A4 TaxID=866773 RepID=E1KZZ4_FINMA|nr:hypothetical protein HMPREF9289_0983 [Finegoldia magna BVS033A4]